jgi:prepilin peptidase CpaA
MPYSTVLAHTVLVITAAVLLYAAWTDLREFKIRNELVLVLVGLFVLHAILTGQWVEIYWNFAVAFGILVISVVFYIRKGMGGGDVKLLTVAFLWAGLTGMLPLALSLLVFAVLQAIAVWYGLMKLVDGKGRSIPFAPTVAAALILTFMLGYVDPPKVSYIPDIQLGDQFRMPGAPAAVPQSR